MRAPARCVRAQPQPASPKARVRAHASPRGNSWTEHCAIGNAFILPCPRRSPPPLRKASPSRPPPPASFPNASGGHRAPFVHHHGGDGVLENQLFLPAGFEHHRILVERADAAR